MVHSHDFYNLYQTTYTKYTEQYGKLVCVFLKKGSFYELYGQEDPKTQKQLNSAKEVLELFGIAIHVYPGEGPHGTTGYFGGVPDYTLDKWAGKLTKLGWTVVVMDEVKNAAGKVSCREVSRVLSAGTHVENAETASSFFLTAMWVQTHLQHAPAFGIAAADLTTGQTFLYEGQATGSAAHWHADDVRHCFQVYPPKELLLFLDGPPILYDEDTLRRTLYIQPTVPIHVRPVSKETQGAFESTLARHEYLQRMFQPKTALPLRTWLHVATDGSSKTERALCGLLRFSEDHASKLAECLQAPKVWHPTATLQSINNALSQLNLVRLGNEQQCVEDLFARPLTAMGKRALSARLCSPLTNPEQIQERQVQIQWLLDANHLQHTQFHTSLSIVHDFARLHRSIYRGTIRAEDIVQYWQSMTTLAFLVPMLATSPFFKEGLLEDIQLCLTELAKQFDLEKAKQAEEKPDCFSFLNSATAGKKSANAETEIQNVVKSANDWLQNFRKEIGLSETDAYYKPTDKTEFVIHGTKLAAQRIEKSVKSPTSNYTKLRVKALTSSVRIEHPALEEFESKLDAAKQQLQRCLAAEVPVACIAYSQATRSIWQPIEDWVVDVDLAFSMAKTAKEQGWVRPELDTDGDTNVPSYLSITNLRHPLIETQKRTSKYVAHTVHLGFGDHGQGWLLYGMNASGKSSLMKAIGLAVCLAQLGSFVPATGMRWRPFRKLATRILNQDNLWAGLSSFAVEMSELRDMFQIADHQTLVLGDELCAGTESVSATAIVAAGIQWLHKTGARFVLATHLHDLGKLPMLKQLPGLKFWHLHVEYDRVQDRLIYHRTLQPGSGSTLYGLEVAKALHLPHEMIESAFAFRRQLLGETALEEAKRSDWNAQVAVDRCSKCGSTQGLETHHIQERQHASNQRNQDGTALNHVRNLVVLCSKCHDEHHNNAFEIGEVQDTSDGPVRQITNLQQYAYEPPKQAPKKKASQWTDEEYFVIQTTLAKDRTLHPRLIALQLKTEHGIQITERQLKQLLSTS